jgi:hypothetical protein
MPTLVAALEFEEVVSIASGYAHTVVLTGEGEIYTWGSGKMGRLGHGADSDEVLPRRVTVHSHPTIKPVRFIRPLLLLASLSSCHFHDSYGVAHKTLNPKS